MVRNAGETIDVSEVTDFSVNQQQHAKAETSRKKGVRRVSRPLAGCRKNRGIRNLPGAASPRHREEGPTSVPRWYNRGPFGSSDIGICGCQERAPGFQEGGDGDRSQACTGPRGTTLGEAQARPASPAAA